MNTWHSTTNTSFTNIQTYWLNRPGALTEGLRKLGQFKIEVLHEYKSLIQNDENTPMKLTPGESIWVREIIMSIDQIPAVFARSLATLKSVETVWKGLKQLQTRPLADMLYYDPSIKRSSFESTHLNPHLSLYYSLNKHFKLKPSECLARRSVFFQQQEPLMVNEVFLPDFWTILSEKKTGSETLI